MIYYFTLTNDNFLFEYSFDSTVSNNQLGCIHRWIIMALFVIYTLGDDYYLISIFGSAHETFNIQAFSHPNMRRRLFCQKISRTYFWPALIMDGQCRTHAGSNVLLIWFPRDVKIFPQLSKPALIGDVYLNVYSAAIQWLLTIHKSFQFGLLRFYCDSRICIVR